MAQPIKIAFSGKMYSGKTTCSNILKQMYPDAFITSFSARLKELATELFDMQTKDRNLLITLGEKMREIDEDVWVKQALKACNKYDISIIDDVRHLNEYTILKQNGWKIIRLNITKDLQEKRLVNNYADATHYLQNRSNLTETELDHITDFDLVIDINENAFMVANSEYSDISYILKEFSNNLNYKK